MQHFWPAITQLDEAVFFFLNNHLGEMAGMQYFFGWTTFLGEAYLLLPLVALLLWVWDRTRWWKVMLIIIAALISAGLVSRLIKVWIDRPRPYNQFFYPFMTNQVTVHLAFHRLLGHSFPSGHVLNVAVITTALNLIYKHKLWWLYVAILWIGLSRVYVGAHFPGDAIAGALLGIVATFMVLRIIARTKLTLSFT